MVATKIKTRVTLSAEGTCPSHSRSDILVGGLDVTIDEPLARGGTNAGPTPTNTALVALIGCTNVIAHKCAARRKLDIGHLAITATCDFDRRGVTLAEPVEVPFTSIVLTVRADGAATQSELDELAAEVAGFCPLATLFRQAGTVIEERWQAS